MTSELNFNYCFATPMVLKWIEVTISVIIIALIESGVRAWIAYSFIVFLGAFCMSITAALLLIYFFGLHRSKFYCWSWIRVETLFDCLAVILNLIGFALAIYDSVLQFDGRRSYQHSKMSSEEWRDRIAAVSAFTGLNGIMYVFSAILANQQGIL